MVVSVIVMLGGLVLVLHGMGRSSTISRSKRMNRMATRKNWREMGVRAFPMGSNPHSYGESLLISGFVGIRLLIV